MKVTNVMIVAVAAAQDDKKVPPRNPIQRLNRLKQFSAEWLNDNLVDLPSKDSWIAKFNNNADRMQSAFNREICGYFNPDLQHGGPDADPDLRPNGVPRRPTTMRRRREGGDGYTNDSGELLRYNKDNPMIGIKQITTGYRKWAERYINECWGQRKHKYQKTRMARWFQILGSHYVSTQQ